MTVHPTDPGGLNARNGRSRAEGLVCLPERHFASAAFRGGKRAGAPGVDSEGLRESEHDQQKELKSPDDDCSSHLVGCVMKTMRSFFASIFLKMSGSSPLRSSSDVKAARALLRYSRTARLSRRSSCSTLSRSIDFGRIHVERPHGIALEVRARYSRTAANSSSRSGGAKRLHPIDGLDPALARQLHGRRFRGFVAGASTPKRLSLAGASGKRVLREGGAARSRCTATRTNRSAFIAQLIDQGNAERPHRVVEVTTYTWPVPADNPALASRCDRATAVPELLACRRIERIERRRSRRVARRRARTRRR